MSVYDNIAFGLSQLTRRRSEIDQRVRKAAERLQLGHLLARKPKELSGGQRQRVAIGRAIVRDPRVFLFDEPLSNLDASLRTHMRLELMNLHSELGTTIVYVTHDQAEAMTLATVIVVLRDGRAEQIGSPLEVYDRPRNRFVAGFIGSPSMNMIEGRLEATDALGAHIAVAGGLRLVVAADARGGSLGSKVTLGLRSEHLRESVGGNALRVIVVAVERLGGESLVHAKLSSGELITWRVVGSSDAKPGDTSVSTLISLAVTCSTKQAMHFPGSDSPQIDSQATSAFTDLRAVGARVLLPAPSDLHHRYARAGQLVHFLKR
jgi:multiple sugar transport system ATP-binding protein